MLDVRMIQTNTETVIKAIEHCKVCQCNECPFRGNASWCVTVLEYVCNKKDEKMG